jgi:hypothetical protein
MNLEIKKLNKSYREIIKRYQFLREEQIELRKKARSYTNCNDVPEELQLKIFEHRILMGRYVKTIREINKKLRKLEHLQSEENLKKENKA